VATLDFARTPWIRQTVRAGARAKGVVARAVAVRHALVLHAGEAPPSFLAGRVARAKERRLGLRIVFAVLSHAAERSLHPAHGATREGMRVSKGLAPQGGWARRRGRATFLSHLERAVPLASVHDVMTNAHATSITTPPTMLVARLGAPRGAITDGFMRASFVANQKRQARSRFTAQSPSVAGATRRRRRVARLPLVALSARAPLQHCRWRWGKAGTRRRVLRAAVQHTASGAFRLSARFCDGLQAMRGPSFTRRSAAMRISRRAARARP